MNAENMTTRILEQKSDIELAAEIAWHINNPCSDGKGKTLREMWIEVGRTVIPTLTNPYATELLRGTIRNKQSDYIAASS